MQAVLLAAGQGTRLRPLTDSLPKPMVPVADRPLVAHAADAAVAGGVSELIIVVGYEREEITAYFGESYRGVPVTFVTQSEQRGTADAVRAAAPELDGPFVVINGDNLYDDNIAALFEEGPAVAAMPVDEPTNYGVLSTDGSTVTDIIEKPADPPSNLANAGAYQFPADAQEYLDVSESERGEYELTDVLARVIDEFEVRVVELHRWLDVGRPWELLEANEWRLENLDRRLDGTVADTATINGAVVVEDGATVKSGSVIEGPTFIGEGATVGPNAYVRGRTVLARNTKVGQSVEIKNSVIMEDSAVPHLSYVGDSVLGREVNFGAGTNVANLRHDDGNIKLTVKGERVSTGRRKFGVVAGDEVKTGINTSLYPGVVLSTGARTSPGESVDRDR